MKNLPPTCRPAALRGFTLLEVLVAAAVLGLVMALVLQIVNALLQSTSGASRQMESTAAARRALDTMATDLQKAVVGENAAILVPAGTGADLFAAVTHRRPPAGQSARFLAVRYFTNAQNELHRAYAPVADNATDLLGAVTNAATTNPPLAAGILAVAVRALGDGTNSYPVTDAPAANWADATYNTFAVPGGYKALLTTGPGFSAGLTNRTRALEVWMAAADARTLDLLTNTSKLATLNSSLDPANPQDWRAAIDAADIPPAAKSAVRVLNRTIPVP
jgi:prepilin-type N-terminal cleavage/methylation domain-containing protein